MDNFLDNGTVLPHGLLSHNPDDAMRGFNNTYKNTALRVGMIANTYPVGDPKNISRLTTEYDVVVIQQDSNRGIASVTYKNCMSAEGLGSIADYFEKTLRKKTMNTGSKSTQDFKGQDGAIVLILCLDGMVEKAIIVGAMTHPDRTTNLTTDEPFLEGEYNGVNIVINTDGSTVITWKGATDSEGEPVDSSQGTTTVQIEKDGSFQAMNDGVTFRMDRTAQTASLTTQKDINFTAQGKMNVMVTGDMTAQCNNLTATTQGKASITVGADATIKVSGSCDITAGSAVNVKGSAITLNGKASGITTANSHQGVIDFITGVPVQPSTTTTGDV